MSKKLTYNHTRFDGGMTDDIRNLSDQTKFAYLSHLDIYRDQGSVFTMPGYVSENGFDGDPEGVKVFDIRAFSFTNFSSVSNSYVMAVANKVDGTGSKLLQYKRNNTQWAVPDSGVPAWTVEGDDDVTNRTWLLSPRDTNTGEFYYLTDGSPISFSGADSTRLTRHGSSATDNVEALADLTRGFTWMNSPEKLIATRGFGGQLYINGFSNLQEGIARLTTTDLVYERGNSFNFVHDIESGDYQVGYVGNTPRPTSSQAVLWDTASLLADQNINLGLGRAVVLGYPGNLWTAVMDESLGLVGGSQFENNGTPSMSIRVLSGETPETLYRIFAPTNTNGVIETMRGAYRDAMTWYARIPTNSAGTEFRQGIWAFGKGDIKSQMGASVLLNTEPLGLIENAQWNGFELWFCHNEDGSVSRLDNFETGTYDVPATIETLVYGAQSPYLKQFEGMTINTSSLPAGGEVTVEYRVDRNTTWQPLSTSDTVGTQRHSFTGTAGESIGRFQEIQFRITLLGKLELTNIFLEITETDDIPY